MSEGSSANTPNSSRTSRAANKIISFTGFGSSKNPNNNGSSHASTSLSSNPNFLSFRFSPESEEIEEVISKPIEMKERNRETGEIKTSKPLSIPIPSSSSQDESTSSLPSSPKSKGGGESSPIKDYIRKNWAHKWDKKSLSLDLDLRGKFISAIEDKRKSMFSHFIPEEGIVQSGIHEHTPVSSSSGQVSGEGGESSCATPSDKGNDVPLNRLSEEYEEIGHDLIAHLDTTKSPDGVLDRFDMSFLSWTTPPENLSEFFDSAEGTSSYLSTSGLNEGDDKKSEEMESFGTIMRNIGAQIVENSLLKYVVCLIAAAIFIPLYSPLSAFLYFISGLLFAFILMQSLEGKSCEQDLKTQEERKTSTKSTNIDDNVLPNRGDEISIENPKSQGWMLFYGKQYKPLTVSFHHAAPVFLHLSPPLLYISTPAPQFRIPRRKLWNDPPLTHSLQFSTHAIYDLTQATVAIAPPRLAQKRTWNKKYPIGIQLPSGSGFYVVEKSEEEGGGERGSEGERGEEEEFILRGDKKFVKKSSDGMMLFLFSRTCREKEDWFRRLIAASNSSSHTPNPLYLKYMRTLIPQWDEAVNRPEPKKPDSFQSMSYKGLKNSENSPERESNESINGSAPPSCRDTPIDDFVDIESLLGSSSGGGQGSPVFFNVVLGRLVHDAVHSSYWALQLQNVIQKKLNYIKRPQFVEVFNVKDLDLGGSIPIIQRASAPTLNSRGLWIDLDLLYEGSFCLTLEAKINLLLLRKSPSSENVSETEEEEKTSEEGGGGREEEKEVGNCYDSDADDSGESSEEEFEPGAFFIKTPSSDTPAPAHHHHKGTNGTNGTNGGAPNPEHGSSKGGKGAKFLKMFEKVASSHFVSENRVVKSAFDKMANTPLLLTVELQELSGTLVVNIPSPPSNRIWIGFRTKPLLKLVTTPKVGVRTVNLNPLTDWIKKKMQQQIQRVLVLPNMDDITVNLMEFKLPS